MPERLIGAVLKTVVRSRVPWVRIPPPPNFKATLKGGFFSDFWAYKHFCKYISNIPFGDENQELMNQDFIEIFTI